jgi:hypothetical protein
MKQCQRGATKYLLSDGVLYLRWKPNELPAKVLLSTEQRTRAKEAAHKQSGHCEGERTIRNVMQRYCSPEMFVDVQDWVTMCEQCKQRAPPLHDEPLKSITVGHLWQCVGRNILYMPKTEDGYLLLVVAWGYLSGWAKVRQLTHSTWEKVANFFYEVEHCQFGTPDSVVVDGGA